MCVYFTGFYAGHWKEGCRHGYGIRGWADLEKLQDGAVSIRQLLVQSISPQSSRCATISGSSSDFEIEKPGLQQGCLSSSQIPNQISNQISHQSTLDLVTEKLSEEMVSNSQFQAPKARYVCQFLFLFEILFF